jgi:hypothetical protein
MSVTQLFTILAIITFAGVIIASAIILARPPRGQTTDKRAKREASARRSRREDELADLRESRSAEGDIGPDKPPYQPPTPGLPPTAGMQAISKLPGQDRLTRDPGTEQHVQPEWALDHLSGAGSPSERPDPPLAAEEPPASGGASPASSPAPTHPATTQMPAVARPAVPGAPAEPHEEPLAPAAPQQDPPPRPPREPDPAMIRPSDGTSLLPLMRETRAERRRREERESRDRPESPQDGH